jgi:hypothetical protein
MNLIRVPDFLQVKGAKMVYSTKDENFSATGQFLMI